MLPRLPFFASASFPWQHSLAVAFVLTPLPSARIAAAVQSGTTATELASERGVPALFSWGDIDGDGRLDLAAVSGAGTLQLLVNAGQGRFEDVTELRGLSEVRNAGLALWADYDGDGRMDVFIGAREGASRLFHNEQGVFVDMTAGSGLLSEGAVQSASWLDQDGDGRLDLLVITAEKNELFRGLEGGFFASTVLPGFASRGNAPGLDGIFVSAIGEDTAGRATPSAPGSSGKKGGMRAGGSMSRSASVAMNGSGGRIALGPTPSSAPALPFVAIPGCLDSINDQANSSTCLEASTAPTLGKLYPISANLFVATGGNIGIGTTSPAAKLDVAGSARMSGTLTLSPSGDQALDVSTGSIYKGSALFIHTRGGSDNTALGREALANVTGGIFPNTGSRNTASGAAALFSNTIGAFNTADGAQALIYNTTGDFNAAGGAFALFSNTSGSFNTASGPSALYSNTVGRHNTASGYAALAFNSGGSFNTASGSQALFNTTGSRNIAIGYLAGRDLTTGNDNIAIGSVGIPGEGATIRIGATGTHTRAFIAGIRGVTTGSANAIPVVVDSAGQLGTVSSSRRFKKDIADMADLTDKLLELRPVVFHYKQEQTLPNGGEVPLEYGLIAEEVAEIFPDLVVYDEEGKPFTVKYHLLSAMLLNEMKKQHEQIETQSSEHERELRELEELRTRLTALEAKASTTAASAESK